jgi:hypothetical protein
MRLIVADRFVSDLADTVRAMRTLDESSALLARHQFDEVTLATHDRRLATAARALGFSVQGAA